MKALLTATNRSKTRAMLEAAVARMGQASAIRDDERTTDRLRVEMFAVRQAAGTLRHFGHTCDAA